MTDASTSEVDASGEAGSADDRPERPPVARFVDALGFVDHARRGFVVGLALALGVFAFFVVLPAVDPGTPARTESVVLYVALAFVVATSGTLLAASALAVRAVAGRVMDYGKWVRRGGVVAAAGGAWWAFTGALALAVASGSVSAGVEALVLSMLPLPVLVLAVGAWAVLARTGSADGSNATDAADATPDADRERDDADGFDHVLARPRVANVGAVLVLLGVAAVHVSTFLDVDAYLGATAPGVAGLVVLGTVALAAGTFALARSLADQHATATLATAAAAIAGLATGLVVGGAFAGTATLVPLATLVLPGLAWTALGVAVARDPGTYPERPI